MASETNRSSQWLLIPLLCLGLVTLVLTLKTLAMEVSTWPDESTRPLAQEQEIIVQAQDLATAQAAVEAVGGLITHRLPVINGVGARVNNTQRNQLAQQGNGLSIFSSAQLEVAGGKPRPYTDYPEIVSADLLHAAGVLGTDIGLAVVDTGIWRNPIVHKNANGNFRITTYDAILDQAGAEAADEYGHGSHISSVAVSSGTTANRNGLYQGVAPNADLVIVKAFDERGIGSYLDVIRGIDWVVQHQDEYNIRVLNLSFSAPPQSYYWEDPLNQAVMRAWQAGIVVVAAAGNSGPDPMTIGVPGNVPYVITVGAFTDNYTPEDPSDDRVTTFSAAGPTVEGFVKPELLAPGGHMLGIMNDNLHLLAQEHPEYYESERMFFSMSGTSQAAAVVSGIVALMLDAHPDLSPDQVKCRLLASASPAVNEGGSLAYSIFQQGAGKVQAYQAVQTEIDGCANVGLNIDLDLAGVEHYGGPAGQDPNTGEYHIPGVDGTQWNGSYSWGSGYSWSNGYTWSNGYSWSSGYTWSNGYSWSNNYSWSNGYTWSSGYTWSAANVSAVSWVEPE